MISSVMAEILRVFHAETVPRLSDGCAPALGMDQLSVSLVTEGRLTEQLWSTGETSTSFEDLQFTVGEGPGPDALRTGQLILERDMSKVSAGRWPALLPAMAGLPIKAVFCLPLALGGITVGVLTALRATPGPMTGQQMDDALALTAALALRFLGGDGEQLVASVRAVDDGEPPVPWSTRPLACSACSSVCRWVPDGRYHQFAPVPGAVHFQARLRTNPVTLTVPGSKWTTRTLPPRRVPVEMRHV